MPSRNNYTIASDTRRNFLWIVSRASSHARVLALGATKIPFRCVISLPVNLKRNREEQEEYFLAIIVVTKICFNEFSLLCSLPCNLTPTTSFPGVSGDRRAVVAWCCQASGYCRDHRLLNRGLLSDDYRYNTLDSYPGDVKCIILSSVLMVCNCPFQI